MEDFVWVLMAGLVLFLLAGALSFPFPQLRWLSGNRKNVTIYSEDIGPIGKIQKSYRDINIGQASAGVTKGQSTVKDYQQIEVSNGLLSKNFVEEEFYANSPEAATLSFRVGQTNLYGKLWVKVNGNKVFEAMAGQNTEPEVKLEGLQTGKNKVTIGVAGSPAKFWASSLYQLHDVKLQLTDYRHKSFQQSFEINEYETTGFSSGKLNFKVEQALRKEALRIGINGHNVYSGRPMKRPMLYTVDFYANNTALSVGENQLTVTTGEDSYYELDNFGIRIYYYGNPEEKTIVRQFTIDKQAYQKLAKDDYQGFISFDTDTHLRGDLNLKLPLRTFSLRPKTGGNHLYFDSEDVKQGSNQLKLRTSGRFDLQNLKIKVIPTQG